jgi:hypothetical protein
LQRDQGRVSLNPVPTASTTAALAMETTGHHTGAEKGFTLEDFASLHQAAGSASG